MAFSRCCLSILDTIVARKRLEIETARNERPRSLLEAGLAAAPPVRDFEAALRAPGLRVIAEVKKASPSAGIIRADFDPVRMIEARAAGADAVLLIAEILPGDSMRTLWKQATALGLHVLVELHDADQLSRVVDSGAVLIGINNRDLRTFKTTLDHTLDLLGQVPAGCVEVSESGIKTHADMQRLEAAGVKAVLVGESLMRSPDIGAALDDLRGVPRT